MIPVNLSNESTNVVSKAACTSYSTALHMHDVMWAQLRTTTVRQLERSCWTIVVLMGRQVAEENMVGCGA